MADSSNKFFGEEHQEQFQYLPYMVFYVLFVFLGVFLINKCLFDRKKFLSKGYDDDYLGSETLPELCASYCFNMFCCCLRPFVGGKRPVLYPTVMFTSFCRTAGAFFLSITRIVSFLLILLVTLYLELRVGDGNIRTFSSWLNILACVFFLFAALLSCIGLFSKVCCKEDDEVSWSLTYEKFGVLCLVLYEAMGANAVFVTLVSYGWLHRPQDTQSVLVHLLVSVCFVVDMCFNKLPYRFEHYFYSLMLPVTYLCFQWALVYDDRMPWQYSFLHTEKNDCFFKYSILFLIHLACYYCIALIHYLRDTAFGVQYEDRHRVAYYEDDGAEDEEEEIGTGGISVTVENRSPTAPASRYDGKDEEDGVPMAQVVSSGRYSPVSQI